MEENDDLNPIPKPDSFLALHTVAEKLFNTLRKWFDVQRNVTIDLTKIDSAVTELGESEMIAAMAMRKLQALHLIATPGVLTTTDVILAIINDLDRALLQAPSMFLERKATQTDWDKEFESLNGESDSLNFPIASDQVDPEIQEFQLQH
ncbi:MAG: hypothetical protein VX480_07605, partial [Actinomycetota bacterium]|nr:hypothetical protein [Actinomycetota bacterium]